MYLSIFLAVINSSKSNWVKMKRILSYEKFFNNYYFMLTYMLTLNGKFYEPLFFFQSQCCLNSGKIGAQNSKINKRVIQNLDV